jgi:uncharacterized membrane protein
MRAIPKVRADALTDGLFAIVMTILVLEIHLPGHTHFGNAQELMRAIAALAPQFIAYAVSFFVLAMFWRGTVTVRSEDEHVALSHAGWWLMHLFVMTCIPVSTAILGTHSSLAPAVWLYAANLIGGAITAWGMALTASDRPDSMVGTHIRLALLVISALLSVAISLVDPGQAAWAYLLNVGAPLLSAWGERGRGEAEVE